MDTKNKTALLIVAAGEGTRMGSLPKAVSLINGKPNLYNTVEKAYEYFDKIIVYSLEKYRELYEEVVEPFSEKVVVESIVSGMGCGDAALTALQVLEEKYYEYSLNPVIIWGDVYINDKRIFEELLAKIFVTHILFPAAWEKNPYVWFKVDKESKLIYSAMFSKRDEITEWGYHDQSIFRVDAHTIRKALTTMKQVLWKNGKYMYGELQFLDVIHFLFNSNALVQLYETEYIAMGYNTHGELMDINKRLMPKN